MTSYDAESPEQMPAARHGEKVVRAEALAARGTSDQEEEISLLSLWVVLLRRRYQVLSSIAIVLFAVIAWTLFTFEPTYTSTASFIPQGARAGGLAAVANEFGLDLPGESGSESPAFYVELLGSREILSRLLPDTFTITDSSDDTPTSRTATLLDLIGPEDAREAVREEAGLGWLNSAIEVDLSRETALVRLRVTTFSASLSRQLGERLITLVNDFNLGTRQSRASAERAFIEQRLEEVRAALRADEEQLKQFLENNRQFQNSPELVFEYDRYERLVVARQQVLTSLSEAYEQARIAEVRNTPVITIVETPHEPATRNSRGLVFRVFWGIFLGGLLGVSLALTSEFWSRRSVLDHPGVQAFRST